ncbi:MAG: O-antigen ligase family protein [Campylobacterota bacterium]|nr:O-antigen ligase family protein [Campylobacterota bacterium]
MIKKAVGFVKKYANDKDLLTLWMNNLLVLYAFLLPISQTIKATIFTYIVLLFIIRGDVINNIKQSLQNPVVRSFLYLFLIYAVGLLWADDASSAMGALKSVKYGLYLIVFYSIVDGRYIDKVIGAFILGMLISELTSYGMIFGVMPWRLEIGDILFYSTQSVGDPSPFLNHIHYGVALAFVVVLLAQKIFYSSSTMIVKVLMSIFVVTATVNIFITGGRTGYISFILLILVLSIFYLRKWAIAALLFASVVLVSAYNMSPIFHAKVAQTQDSIYQLFEKDPNFNTSIGVRVGMFYYAADSIKEHPLLGVGTGSAMIEILKNTPQKWTGIHDQPHAHNQFLSILVSLGVVGLLVFLNIYYQIFRYKQDIKDLRFIMIFSTLAIAFGILTTQFNLRFFLPLWVVMLAVTLINRDRRTIKFMPLNNKKQMFQIIGIGILFSISSLVHQLL